MRPATRTTLRCWLLAALALGALLGAGYMLPALNQQRTQMALRGYAGPEGVPPSLAIATTALGPFRAILIDILWIRATNLQDEGKVFELVQLYDWISTLEPRIPQVWAHSAWNMAYNVSVKFPVPSPGAPRPRSKTPGPEPEEERWRWVQRGIEVLRDKGIPYNPNASLLYREIAWIYDHKIGQSSDDAHEYYKIRLALQVQNALGEPPYENRLKALAAEPESIDPLLDDDAIRSLVGRLRAAGVRPLDKALAIVSRSADLPPAAAALLRDPANAASVARLDSFLRAYHLRRVLKLDPARMLDLMKLYGPIDWRLPDALSLYWAARGIEVFGWEVDKVANTDRILFHALTNLFRRGRLRFVSAQGDEPLSASIWDTAPHFAFLKRVVELQESIVKRYKGTAQEDPTRDGFMNFLREVVLSLYIHGDQKSAATYFKMLQGYGPEQNLTLDEFIRRRYEEEVKTLNYEQTCNLIQAHFFDCFWWVSLGDVDQANAAEARARALAKAYEAQDRRLRLPPLRSLRKNALREAIRSLKRFQVDRLREVYPDEVKEIEKESEKPAPPRQGQPAPPRAS